MLNAFRHHRVLREHWTPESGQNRYVLNAFRHHRVLRTGWRQTRRPCDFGAQRLSASQGVTRKDSRNPPPALVMCSTPFGITGCYANRVFWVSESPSRAQRLSASQGVTQFVDDAVFVRLIVLNAFRHHRVLRRATVMASKILSSVLNAFRHHRVLRHPIEDEDGNQVYVLNAFRHHRVLRERETRASQQIEKVLNAFRHHRVVTPGRRSWRRKFCRACSTPFGITGCYAIRSRTRTETRFTCSTPFGITGCYARRTRCDIHSRSRVLNAFRHHRVLRRAESEPAGSLP